MLTKHLCLVVLLLPHALLLPAAGDIKCSNTFKNATEEQKCATVDLLNGWLNVVNRTATRSLEVLRNATLIKNGVDSVRNEAEQVLESAKKIMKKLRGNSTEASTVQKTIDEMNGAIKRINESEHNATLAIDAASTAERQVTNGFGSISLAAGYFVDNNHIRLEYDFVRQKVDKIPIDKSKKCTKALNVSSKLRACAEQLDSSTLNLTAWKAEMLSLLQATHDELQSNTSTCLMLFTKDKSEKLREVMFAVGNASEKLIVAVEKFNTARSVIEAVEANIPKAENNVKSVITTAHESLKRNAVALCDVYKKRGAVTEALEKTRKHLEELGQKVAKAATQAQAMQVGTGSTSARVHEVVEKLTTVVKLYGAVGGELSSNAANAKQSISSADEKSKHAVAISVQATSGAKSTEEKMNEKFNKLNDATETIKKLLGQIGIGISSVDSNNCSDDLSALLIGSWEDAERTTVKLDETALTGVSKSLEDVELKVNTINSDIITIADEAQTSLDNAEGATNFEKEAVAAASIAVIEALSKMMSQLCAASAGLRDLRSKSAALSQRAAALKASVSDEKLRAAAVLADASGPKELPAHVEDAFATASRRAAVAEKLLQSSDAKRGNVNTKLGAGMRKSGSEGQGSTIHGRIDELVRNISSGISSNASPDVCETTYITKLMQSLKRSDDELILPHNALVITELAQFTVDINSGVKNARRQMERATASAGEAEAALAEAMRVAREESAQRHCTPLHRQLLSVLRRMW
ncbi:hypothetical protein ERJ75_000112800 [Trypanosoma vivax]|nr:hypothetical protein ERJ75_000112800 [Trypanosoma vivax]